MNRSNDAQAAAAHWRTALRSWYAPLVVIALGVASMAAVQAGMLRFSARPACDFIVLLGTTQLALVAWVFFLSPLRSQKRLIAIMALVSLQAGLHQLVRLDGFTGDGRLIWKWRWVPTPQETFEHSQRGRRSLMATANSVDLAHTTPNDYPAFRGSERTGRASDVRLATDWRTHSPRQLWKQPIGAGWSSFAVVGEFCVTQEQRGEEEATVCYELRTGRERWAHLERARFNESTGGEGPRATPTIQGGRVFSLGATGVLNCLDGASGRPLWTVNILSDNLATNRLFGVAGSPLVVGSLVVVNPGGRASSLAAYDIDTGRRVWRAGNAGASYSSPQAARLCGVDQVLDFNADGLFAHELSSGSVLWSVPWISNPAERNNVCQPVVTSGIRHDAHQSDLADCVFISSGYGMGCALLEVHKRGSAFDVSERWRNRNLKAKFSSVVEHDGHVFGLDESILTCVELASGRRKWKGGRYGYGQLVLVGSTLLVQLESGEVALVDAAPDSFRELGRFAPLADRTWNHPALAGRHLLVRNDREAACYELLGREPAND